MPAVVREQEREVAAEGHADEAAHGRDYDGALQVEPVGGTDPRGEFVAEREKLAQHRARGERLVRRLEQLRVLEAPPGRRLERAAHPAGEPAVTEGPVTPQPASPCASDGSVDRKSTRLNSSHANISYAVFCLKKKKL